MHHNSTFQHVFMFFDLKLAFAALFVSDEFESCKEVVDEDELPMIEAQTMGE